MTVIKVADKRFIRVSNNLQAMIMTKYSADVKIVFDYLLTYLDRKMYVFPDWIIRHKTSKVTLV